MKLILIIASVSAFIAVALGAIGAHAFKDILVSTGKSAQFQTASEYQWYHTIGLFVLMGLYTHYGNSMFLNSAYVMLAGMLLFSGSLYAYSLSGIKVFAHITPIGGLAFLAAWAICVWGLIKVS